jgi:CO/xanthine dehydrogenase Mo-binding subunit
MIFWSNQFLDYILGACRADRKTAGQGAGEGGIVAVAAAIGNAVAAALASFGVEPKELPLTPARIWRLVQNAQTAAGAREQGP